MGITDKATIFTVAQYGDLNKFKEKFNISEINAKSDSKSSLLHYAIIGRNFDIALYLIENNIDVNITNSDGQTPLHLIAVYPNIEIAKEILDKGGDINIRDKYGNNPMWTAVFNCKGRYYDLVELFIKYNPDIHSKNQSGKSPLDFALQVGNDKLISILTMSL